MRTSSNDANGNLTSDGSTTYGYDVENRLISATGTTSGCDFKRYKDRNQVECIFGFIKHQRRDATR